MPDLNLAPDPDGDLVLGPQVTNPPDGLLTAVIAAGGPNAPMIYLEPSPDGPYTLGPLLDEPSPDWLSVEWHVVRTKGRGVPTLEAVHVWDDRIALNDRTDLDVYTNPARYRLSRVTLRTQADPTLPSTARTAGTGDIPHRGRRGSVNAVYEGTIEAVDASWLRQAADELLAAFDDVTGERQMLIRCDPRYRSDQYVYAGRGSVTVEDDPRPAGTVPTQYQQTFVVTIVRTDPRIYDDLERIAGQASMPPAAGLALPWPRLPIVLSSFGTATASLTVDIDTKVPTPLILDLYGPLANPTVTDETRGLTLALDYDIGANETVTVKPGAGVFSDVNGDITPAVRWPESTWWDARNADTPAGTYDLRLDSTTDSQRGSISVRYRPAS